MLTLKSLIEMLFYIKVSISKFVFDNVNDGKSNTLNMKIIG